MDETKRGPTMPTRAEHVRWCKERALKEFDFYKQREGIAAACRNGIASMFSDLSKHPDTKALGGSPLGLMAAFVNSESEFRRFIDGFAE